MEVDEVHHEDYISRSEYLHPGRRAYVHSTSTHACDSSYNIPLDLHIVSRHCLLTKVSATIPYHRSLRSLIPTERVLSWADFVRTTSLFLSSGSSLQRKLGVRWIEGSSEAKQKAPRLELGAHMGESRRIGAENKEK